MTPKPCPGKAFAMCPFLAVSRRGPVLCSVLTGCGHLACCQVPVTSTPGGTGGSIQVPAAQSATCLPPTAVLSRALLGAASVTSPGGVPVPPASFAENCWIPGSVSLRLHPSSQSLPSICTFIYGLSRRAVQDEDAALFAEVVFTFLCIFIMEPSPSP